MTGQLNEQDHVFMEIAVECTKEINLKGLMLKIINLEKNVQEKCTKSRILLGKCFHSFSR